MGVVLGVERGIADSRPDYEEAMALTRRLREQRFLGGKVRVKGLSRMRGASGGDSNVLAHGLGWGIGLGLGFWLSIALVCRQLL